jgi:uncharacterized protein (TIGR02646 family)
MISLDGKSRFNDVPVSLDTSRKIPQERIGELAMDRESHKVVGGYNAESVQKKLRKYQGHKCIYCESIPIGTSAFRVDHFRPKKHLAEDSNHSGYFWLAYEWTNLVHSCETCNGKKSNKFPISNPKQRVALSTTDTFPSEADRKLESPILSNEERLLLHPEIDKVENHLRFLWNGLIEGVDEKGKTTIEVCDLNRGDLIWRRKRKIDSYWTKLITSLNDYEDRMSQVIIQQDEKYARMFLWNDLRKWFIDLLGEQEEGQEYSRLGYFMFHDFEKFFLGRDQNGFTIDKDLNDHAEMIRSFYRYLLSLK